MCTVNIRTVVGIDSNGDNDREAIVVVGTIEDCSGLKVALFNSAPPAGAQISDSAISRAATILAAGVGAHGVTPIGNQRVFTVTFTLDDTTSIKGRCGRVFTGGGVGLLAVCDDDSQCRAAVFWDQPIDCVDAGCPQVTITPGAPEACVNQTRSVGLGLVASPFSAGLSADVDFGDGSAAATAAFAQVNLPGGGVIGSASAVHNYSVPGTGTQSFHVTVTIAGRPECRTEIDLSVDACPAGPPPPPPPPPGRCPVERITLRVLDASGTDVTGRLQDGACLPPGRYVVRADIVPAGATSAFAWRVDGIAAAVGQRGVVAINGARLTIELTTAFRSVSVIAAGCASDGVDLRPCKEVCCPDLTGVTATCMPRCPPATTATLTATGTDIACAESFDWEFGDGAAAETPGPTATHTYPRLGRFDAAVTIVRPRECGRPRTQRRTVTVEPCPPSCFCAFLAVASGLLLLALLTLLPLIACVTDPTARQALIVALIVVAALLAAAWLWWLIDPCCRPTRCELLRILFWVFSWALIILGILAIFCTFGVIPFGFAYAVAQQIVLRMINAGRCGPPPDVLSWPFPACRRRG
jgi:PKD domain